MQLTLTPSKTYATEANAVKAVTKIFGGNSDFDTLTWWVHHDAATGRFFPVFIGTSAIHAGVHFHFNCVSAA